MALLSSGGVYLKGWQAPFDDQHPWGDGGFRELPTNVQSEDLAAAHSHYDHKYVDQDINVVFPLDRLRELQRDAYIGSVAPLHYTFMGFVTRPYQLLADSALQMAWRLKMANVDAAVLVVQHMPAGFTRSLATRLDAISAIRVREAADGDALEPGLVLIAPGGQHMLLRDDGRVTLSEEPPLHGVRPAVDKLLLSVANHWHQPCLGVILTGMGHDGARGIAALKRNGGQSIAEDASTCVVYGMPRAVVELGLADDVLPVHEIPAAIVRHTRARRDEVRA